uniref:ferredoxin-dependent glutamate synthase n=1 Tax=Timspurckia oligopyrenoides TaxID=708627 RepID=UPI001FCD182B|nr:ferredoxin-dependent glutamate synthase [Timspurckia oligopyrenoides]UNJ17520.1 ferredoxin-dependent glutamate synthase [Timspurckia oligopyrenoides]
MSKLKLIQVTKNLASNYNNICGSPSVVLEKDACGVGFIADINNKTSHKTVMYALEALNNMEHRGGCGADKDSGDGAGITTGIPWTLFGPYLSRQNIQLHSDDMAAVGMFFFPTKATRKYEEIVEWVFSENDIEFLTWRDVPVVKEVLGRQASENQPVIKQAFIKFANRLDPKSADKALYLIRKKIEKSIASSSLGDEQNFYVCSLSTKVIIYKGMVRSAVLGQFYKDLYHPKYESSFAIYHRRFSTNTMPKWPLAQPMRFIAHNGEINTLLGNLNWMKARESFLADSSWKDSMEFLTPITNAENSDSANLDTSIELLINSGYTPEESLMVLIPEAYRNQPALEEHPEITSFYEYYAPIQESWDGPALITFTDGSTIGASLDRNGLRPARYCITNDNLIIVSSESGAVEIPGKKIIEKGRLGPGQMISVDLGNGIVNYNWDIKLEIARKKPYKEWIEAHRKYFSNQSFKESTFVSSVNLLKLQTLFGYSLEDVELVIEHMASQGKEPTFCMGDDIPLAVLSSKPHLIYDYFKQRFAQVTNPAIDPLREKLVMNLTTYLVSSGNILRTEANGAGCIELKSPVINEHDLELLRSPCSQEISLQFHIGQGRSSLELAVNDLCEQSYQLVQGGKNMLILSDQNSVISNEGLYIPPLIAVGAVHHYLIQKNVRNTVTLIVSTAQCWSTHHFACLIGYGASAVCPYLALETVRHWWNNPRTQNLMKQGKLPSCNLQTVQDNYQKAVEAGLLKILSKMGISQLSSYHGAQIFEILGLNSDIVNLCFSGTTSRISGLTTEDICNEIVNFHNAASETDKKKLINLGFIQYRPGAEYHVNNPEMSKSLHKAVRGYNPEYYQKYSSLLYHRPPTALRDLLKIKSDRKPIHVDEVESIEKITRLFCTGGMSLGALSRETHETLAIAMNRIQGKSNSGEGGEDPLRYISLTDVDTDGYSKTFPHLKGLKNGDRATSVVKQIASGRFGVTPEYLMNADQLEIKIAQGAKPGEGGQLPGKKVSKYIASLRGCKPGVTLISPPPHHDIYSIEDLAQLIFDLHQINPSAKVSVKLVAEVGIGTIAAGVAKGNADIIQISGHDGGTGASPLSSIKHAGSPWELGLTEVHRVLLENNLRNQVLLRVDGGLRTGKDVILAAMMGAEEFGFGTVAMIATGCIMARICHTNSCPVGVATQRKELRARYPGVPEALVNFFVFLAQEVRENLAEMGYKKLEDIIGRADLLEHDLDLKLSKTDSIDLSTIINLPETKINRGWLIHGDSHTNGLVIDDDILASAVIADAIENHAKVTKNIKIVNTDRSVGARIAGTIAKKYGNAGFKGTLELNFFGSAGQSFGAFIVQGMRIRLTGEANDYVAKGMNGGEISIVPPNHMEFKSSEQVIVGNTCLYGASGGKIFINGQAGERFAVRNSNAIAVVEGVGDHACEYMTGGIVVVLGPIGRNFGAGMTGGLAYVLDEENQVLSSINKEIVTVQRIQTKEGAEQLKALLDSHFAQTHSEKTKGIIAKFDTCVSKFWQVVPPSESNEPETNPNFNKILEEENITANQNS